MKSNETDGELLNYPPKTTLYTFLQLVDIEKYNYFIQMLRSNELLATKFLERIPSGAVDEIANILIKHELSSEYAVAISMIAIEKYKYFYKR